MTSPQIPSSFYEFVHEDRRAPGNTMTAGKIKRVLVFGRSGVGKSTVANMLLTGSPGAPFRADDTATGVTANCETRSIGDYAITDTVGFGEAVHPENAEEMFVKYLERVGSVGYSHVAFVTRAGRIERMDPLLWEIFLEIFKGAELGFLVVFTNATKANWIDINRSTLEKTYKKCPSDRFVAVNFPSTEGSENYCWQQREESRSRLNAAMDRIFKENRYQYYVPEYSTNPVNDAEDSNQPDWPWLMVSLQLEDLGQEHGSQSQAPLKVSDMWEHVIEEGNVHRAGSSRESSKRDGKLPSSDFCNDLIVSGEEHPATEMASKPAATSPTTVSFPARRRAKEKAIQLYKRAGNKSKMWKTVKKVSTIALAYGFTLSNIVCFLFTGMTLPTTVLDSVLGS